MINYIHASTVDGDCSDLNCQDGIPKNAVVHTFAADHSQAGVQALLDINKNHEIELYFMQVPTEKIRNLVLVIVDTYKNVD